MKTDRNDIQTPLAAPTFVDAWKDANDEQWLHALSLATYKPFRDWSGLPAFPPDQLQIDTVGSAHGVTMHEAVQFYSYVRSSFEQHHGALGRDVRILDFGVCWGRIIRCFLRDVDPHNLFGVDVSDRYLDAARETGIPARLHKIAPTGELPFSPSSFDLIYAYSIFTHLPEHAQDHWLERLARALRPDGLLVVTIQPPRFLDYVEEVAQNETAHEWYSRLKALLDEMPDARASLEASGSLFLPTNNLEHYGDRVIAEPYVHKHWSRWFEVLEYVDDPGTFAQAVVTLRPVK